MRRILITGLATFFGTGFFPVAPGTLASLFIALGFRFWFHRISWPLYLAIGLAVFFLGVWASAAYATRIKKKDPRTVVIDEVVGQWIALLLVPPIWWAVLTSFLLFRIFDVIKPMFIHKAESFRGGWGIMLDDILAGIYASIILNILLLKL
ncbi:MAG: phosphatidylglycerophosphatase A [Candidatus Aminicenantaceae bacterium]